MEDSILDRIQKTRPLIYFDDLKHCAADKMIQPLVLLPNRSKLVQKSNFGYIIRTVHPQTVSLCFW